MNINVDSLESMKCNSTHNSVTTTTRTYGTTPKVRVTNLGDLKIFEEEQSAGPDTSLVLLIISGRRVYHGTHRKEKEQSIEPGQRGKCRWWKWWTKNEERCPDLEYQPACVAPH